MISILMSTNNPIEEYFEQCLECIFSQTYKNYELVLIDDGSDESVMNYLKKKQYDLSKLKYIRLEQNVGLPRALNIGLKHCSGDYIARMDDDDLMSFDRLEKQLNYIEKNNLDGCFSYYNHIDNENKVVASKTIFLKESKFLKQLLAKGNIFCHGSLFVKKSVLLQVNGYDENLRYAQDSDIYIRILKKYKIGLVKEALLSHRINNYRTSTYRDTLSLTYALFGAMNYFTSKEKITIKDKVIIFKRLIRYFISIIRIQKK